MVNELETWRAARGMTQQQLADAAGLSTSTIDRAESGDCGRKAARALAQVTGIRPAVLLGLEAPEGDSEDTDPVPRPPCEESSEGPAREG